MTHGEHRPANGVCKPRESCMYSRNEREGDAAISAPRKPPPTDGTTHGFHQAPSLTARPQEQLVGCPGVLVVARITGRLRECQGRHENDDSSIAYLLTKS